MQLVENSRHVFPCTDAKMQREAHTYARARIQEKRPTKEIRWVLPVIFVSFFSGIKASQQEAAEAFDPKGTQKKKIEGRTVANARAFPLQIFRFPVPLPLSLDHVRRNIDFLSACPTVPSCLFVYQVFRSPYPYLWTSSYSL